MTQPFHKAVTPRLSDAEYVLRQLERAGGPQRASLLATYARHRMGRATWYNVLRQLIAQGKVREAAGAGWPLVVELVPEEG